MSHSNKITFIRNERRFYLLRKFVFFIWIEDKKYIEISRRISNLENNSKFDESWVESFKKKYLSSESFEDKKDVTEDIINLSKKYLDKSLQAKRLHSFSKIIILYSKNEYIKAEFKIRNYLNSDKTYGDIIYLYSCIKYNQNKYLEGYNIIKENINEFKLNKYLCNRLAAFCINLDKMIEAKYYIEESLKIDINFGEAYGNKGYIKFKEENWSKANYYFKKSLILNQKLESSILGLINSIKYKNKRYNKTTILISESNLITQIILLIPIIIMESILDLLIIFFSKENIIGNINVKPFTKKITIKLLIFSILLFIFYLLPTLFFLRKWDIV